MWNSDDIQINTYHSAVPDALYHVQLTHVPTGTIAKASNKSYFRAMKTAREQLADLLVDNTNG